MEMMFAPALMPLHVSDRLLFMVRFRQQSIQLREKNIVDPTERSQNAKHFASSEGRIDVFR